MAYKLAIIGVGKMGLAITQGVLHKKLVTAEELILLEHSEERTAEITKILGKRKTLPTITAKLNILQDTDCAIIIAVKPSMIDSLLSKLVKVVSKDNLIISIMAGVSIAKLEDVLPKNQIIRTMPNMPASINEGMTVLSPNTKVTTENLAWAQEIFTAVGRVQTMGEEYLDAVTGLSGSGPAYVYKIIEALADGGLRLGLPKAIALELAAQTVMGAAQVMLHTGEHPSVLKDQVTTPGGTTIAGLHELEKGNLHATLMNAVVAAAERSHQMHQ